MWFALGLFFICLTIIVLFRMYIDLRRVDHQHIRMLQSDARSYQRYVEVSSRPAPRAEMPDFTGALQLQQREILELERRQAERNFVRSIERNTGPMREGAPPQTSLEDLRAAERMVKARCQAQGRPATMTDRELNDAVRRYLQEDYDGFIDQQRRTL